MKVKEFCISCKKRKPFGKIEISFITADGYASRHVQLCKKDFGQALDLFVKGKKGVDFSFIVENGDIEVGTRDKKRGK